MLSKQEFRKRLNKLAQMGLVEIRSDGEDERLVGLTKRGEIVAGRALREFERRAGGKR